MSCFQQLVRKRFSENSETKLIGFDVSRHLISIGNEYTDRVIDLPIAEESIAGIAIGLSRCGVDVFVDFMFEGFMARCFEPLTNGLINNFSFFDKETSQIVFRALSGPFAGCGSSHSGYMPSLISSIKHLIVVSPIDFRMLESSFLLARQVRCPLLILEPADNIDSRLSNFFSRQIEPTIGSRLLTSSQENQILIVAFSSICSLVIDVLKLHFSSNFDMLIIGFKDDDIEYYFSTISGYKHIIFIGLEYLYTFNFFYSSFKHTNTETLISIFDPYCANELVPISKEDVKFSLIMFLRKVILPL